MIKKLNQIVLFLIIISFIFCWSAFGEVVDKIVAIVNNDIVTLVQLNKGTQNYRIKIDAGSYSEDQKQTMLREVNDNILNALIDQSLTHQEAKRYRIKVSEHEINQSVKNVMRSKSLSKEEFEKALDNEDLTLKDYRKNIKDQILQNKIINHAVKSKVVILESDIVNYYNSHKEQYSGEIKHHLRNILMHDKKIIENVKKQLDENKDFKNLAKKYSIAPNSEDNGDLGMFEIKNFPDNIKEEISKLKKNQYSGIVSTSQGFQIFYIEDIILKDRKTYDQAHDEIHDILYNDQVEKKFLAWLESLKQKAHIKIML
jgi:peptidyl-prolyl cis-trans isomerase SurA